MNHSQISLSSIRRFILAIGLTLAPLMLHASTLAGDLDGDAVVNITDVTELISYLLTGDSTSINVTAADVDGDGRVNIEDVTGLINMLLTGTNGSVVIIDVTPTVKVRMIKVEGGTYWMGCDPEQAGEASTWETPSHKVTTGDFLIGETEVTQQLWQAVMGNNPSRFAGNPRHPVEGISWNDCQQFIARLRAMTGEDFRLPTEAEWEFAARGGVKGRGYTFAGNNDVNRVAWWGYNVNGGECTSHPVATLSPNELGIHDMSGNVWEWCQDWFAPYQSDEAVNPTGPATGSSKVLRGGSWSSDKRDCRVSERYHFAPTLRGDLIGMRLALPAIVVGTPQ